MPTITQEQYERFKEDQQRLQALENAGVDNWEGYDVAMEEIFARERRVEKAQEITNEIDEILSDALYEPSERGAGYAFREDALLQVRALILPLIGDK